MKFFAVALTTLCLTFPLFHANAQEAEDNEEQEQVVPAPKPQKPKQMCGPIKEIQEFFWEKGFAPLYAGKMGKLPVLSIISKDAKTNLFIGIMPDKDVACVISVIGDLKVNESGLNAIFGRKS